MTDFTRTPLDWQFKAAPVGASAATVAELVASRVTLSAAGFLPPVMTLRQSALEANVAELAAFCRRSNVALAPHGKTHMSPAIAARQLAAGAWGVTVANASQARVYRAFGVSRIFCANVLADPASIRWVADELAADDDFEFVAYVDSIDGVRLLDMTLAAHAGIRPLDVIVEVGVRHGGRTGARNAAVVRAVAAAAARTSRLRLVGVAGFEGGIGHGEDPNATAQVQAFLRELRDAAVVVADYVRPDSPFFVSAGGSAFFDLVVAELAGGEFAGREVTVLLRSGCYVVHDSGTYAEQTPFGRTLPGSLEAALRLWAVVLSVPEPGLALLGAGRRDTSFDLGLPIPQVIRHPDGAVASAAGLVVTGLDDQHAYVRVADGVEIHVGDWVGLGISHPCTALDKWRFIVVVDDDDRVMDCIQTYF